MTEDAASMSFTVTLILADQTPFPGGVGLELVSAGEVVAAAETRDDGTALFAVDQSTLTEPAIRFPGD